MRILPLVFMTTFLVLGVVGTVGKLLFDDWRVRQITKLTVAALPETSGASDSSLKAQD